jgi:CAAX prenyl protease-like protein
MNPFLKRIAASPLSARAAPLFIFCLLTAFQGHLGADSQYWVYLVKTVLGAWMVWSLRPVLPEMRWKFGWEAVVAGVLVFALWTGLQGFYPTLGKLLGFVHGGAGGTAQPTPWNPPRDFGAGSTAAWFFIAVRILGSSLVVPPLEEVFFRSFLYRYIVASDFLEVPLSRFVWRPFLLSALFFGFYHQEWLPGILCAFVYQGLVCWKGRLGDAMAAHAVTNFLLGCWVVWRPAWNFW